MLCSLNVKLLLDREFRTEEADKIANKDYIDMTLCKLSFSYPFGPICLLEYLLLSWKPIVTHKANNWHVTLDNSHTMIRHRTYFWLLAIRSGRDMDFPTVFNWENLAGSTWLWLEGTMVRFYLGSRYWTVYISSNGCARDKCFNWPCISFWHQYL